MIGTNLGKLGALTLATAALCGVVAWEFFLVPSIDGGQAERPGNPQVAQSSNDLRSAIQAGSWMSEVLGRPIFSPDRRPVEAAGKSAGGLRLTGIIVSDSGKVAIFARPAGARAMIVEEGGEIDGSKVLEVTTAGVLLLGPTGRTTVTPIYDPAPRPRSPSPIPVKTEVPR